MGGGVVDALDAGYGDGGVGVGGGGGGLGALACGGEVVVGGFWGFVSMGVGFEGGGEVVPSVTTAVSRRGTLADIVGGGGSWGRVVRAKERA